MLIIFRLIFNHTHFLQSTQFEEILILINTFTVYELQHGRNERGNVGRCLKMLFQPAAVFALTNFPP